MTKEVGTAAAVDTQPKTHMHLRPHVGRLLTQGAIFSCAMAENYAGCEVHGLVLTARCDLTQDKAPVTNYVPVVAFDDWLHRDFFVLLLDRCEADLRERFETFLANHGLAKSLLIAHSPKQIVDAHFLATSSDREVINARAKGMALVERFENLEAARAIPPGRKPVLDLAKNNEGIRSRLVKDCIQQRLFGYYFLPAVALDGHARGYVALLREVHHLPSGIAASIAIGLGSAEYQAMLGRPEGGPLSIPKDGMAFVTAVMQSPFVEHLLQVFGMLFGRIGLPDPDDEYTSSIWSNQPSVAGGSK